MRITSVLALSAVLSACGLPGEDFCTLEARASVQVNVVDPRGTPVRDARVTFSLNGSAEQLALCNGSELAQGNCDTWVTSYEQPGNYVVTATSANGQRTARQSVTVGEDECHVQTQTVTLTLPD
ncbi:Ig-like domain-containing protein [Archangium violaceum]|uniref:Ig-like domain-containing protein n=1 Tax=Archangium violaceum TaxID=83451 RepID=UPI0036D85826